jgi:hypothetical protein
MAKNQPGECLKYWGVTARIPCLILAKKEVRNRFGELLRNGVHGVLLLTFEHDQAPTRQGIEQPANGSLELRRNGIAACKQRTCDSMLATSPGQEGRDLIAATWRCEIITISCKKVIRACSRSPTWIMVSILSATAVWSRSCKGGS